MAKINLEVLKKEVASGAPLWLAAKKAGSKAKTKSSLAKIAHRVLVEKLGMDVNYLRQEMIKNLLNELSSILLIK